MSAPAGRLIAVEVDEKSLAASGAQAEQERRIAVSDLLEDNAFAVVGGDGNAWKLRLSRSENRLVFDIACERDRPALSMQLSLSPFRKVIKDYWRICESYYEAIEVESRARIETIDMARKAIHDEGSNLLRERLAGRATMDEATARRLFTLVCALHRPGLGP